MRSCLPVIRSVLALTVCGALTMFVLAACQYDDEPVGHTKTTTKRTIDTPTEKTTVTETHEKNTTLSPR